MRRLLLLLVLCAVTLPAAAQKNDWQYWETPMQFTPIIFDLGAEYLGIQPKHNVWERTVAVAAGPPPCTRCSSICTLLSNGISGSSAR